MAYVGSRQVFYSETDVANALDAFARDHGSENRFAAMRIVIVDGLEAAGYLQPGAAASSNFLNTLSDDVTI